MRVRAAGINGADLAQRAGRYPPPPGRPPDIPGLECAGEVVALGHGVRDFVEGDRVMALLGGGGHAELVTVHEWHALPCAGELVTDAEAGGFIEVFATAHDALFTQAELTRRRAAARERRRRRRGRRRRCSSALAAGAQRHGRSRATAPSRLEALGADTTVAGEYDVILELVGGDNLADDLEPARRRAGGSS